MADNNSTSTQDRRAYRIKDFCALYSISRSSAYKLMAEGKLRSIRVGGRRLIPKECAEALLQGEAAPEAKDTRKRRD
jgi:excisionase family DNA binding protein